MSGRDDGNSHNHGRRRKPAGGPDDGAGFDWFAVFDIAVWVSVAVIAVLAVEWLIGHVVRESLASGASKLLKREAQQQTGD